MQWKRTAARADYRSMTLLVRAIAVLAASSAVFGVARAEQHTVHFVNNCGFGTPILEENGTILSMGEDYHTDGPLIGAIAFLQTGHCGTNGEGCTVIEITLQNPTSPGNGSSADISLIPPHAFSVTAGFGYFNGCDGIGFDCTNPNCGPPFLNSGVPQQFRCETNDVNLAITFCD